MAKMRPPMFSRFRVLARPIEPWELPPLLHNLKIGEVLRVDHYSVINIRATVYREHAKTKRACKWRTHNLPAGLFIERWA